MFRHIISFSILMLISTTGFCGDNILRLYNWEDYMPQEVLDGFENETGYKVEQVYYETDELKEDLIIQTNGKGLDLIIGSSDSFVNYVRQGGVISKLDSALVSNMTHVDQRWSERYPELSDYAVPFFWGTLGIAYRKDLVQFKVFSWEQLLKPEESLRGKIMMLEDKRDLFTPALKLLGYSSNETNYRSLMSAGQLLADQRPFVKSYQYVDMTEESELINGSVWMALAYNGDALTLKELDDNIEFVVPKEGTNIWMDYIAIFESSTNKEAAHAFINYINSPAIAANLAEALYYASPNMAAEKLLPDDFLNDEMIYPPLEVFQKSEIVMPLKGRVMGYYNNIFNNIVTQ